MRALLKAPVGKSILVDEQNVGLIARTGNRRIKVEFNKGVIRAVDRYRLFDALDRTRQITEAEFDALPWEGAGPDPATASFDELLDHMARP